ncbi:hypothetical protein GCM10027290_55880 [Micromonospora sonneratiae]|jgi:DNA-binding MarR family transcriptional regulator|uniref:MarR family winged helix-turn-helix transcriptional regulator n=1 Tax=Micromonospora sonneratiae TaxID=1184706 RepID=A0ABW3YGZ5_9ACTN
MDFAEVVATNKALVKTAKLYRGAQAALLADLGLHPGQDVVLWTLGQEPTGLLVSEIAERLGIEQPTVTRTLARLEPGDWFTREPVPGDRRAVRIKLTEKGLAAVPQVEAVWRRLADTATTGLDPAERRQLVATLDRVRINLTTLSADQD